MTDHLKADDRTSSSKEVSAELVKLMMKYQRRIFAYIHTLVPSRSDAEDILQDACVTICEKFDQFKIGTNFYSWACQISYWKVRAARKKFATSKVVFNQEVLDCVAETRSRMERELDYRHDALARCLEKLNARDRRMVLTRYEPGNNVAQAAQSCGRTIQGAYKALTRIRKVLHDCVTFEVSMEGAGSVETP
jgi:RNA polymerase sigma-70 factor (ECF subfamily)